MRRVDYFILSLSAAFAGIAAGILTDILFGWFLTQRDYADSVKRLQENEAGE